MNFLDFFLDFFWIFCFFLLFIGFLIFGQLSIKNFLFPSSYLTKTVHFCSATDAMTLNCFYCEISALLCPW